MATKADLTRMQKEKTRIQNAINTECGRINSEVSKFQRVVRSSSVDEKKVSDFIELLDSMEETAEELEGQIDGFTTTLDEYDFNTTQLKDLWGAPVATKKETQEEANNKTRKEWVDAQRANVEKIKKRLEAGRTAIDLYKNNIINALNSPVRTADDINKKIKLLSILINERKSGKFTKEEREIYDRFFKDLRKDIKRLKKKLTAEGKDLTAITECEKDLDELEAVYRSKCCLRVRAVKSAADFYRKHKKLVLISAGLIAVTTVVDLAIGLGPFSAIMRGNNMISSQGGPLQPVFSGLNNFIGQFVAKHVDGRTWYSNFNGVRIDSPDVSHMVLKGLALIGLNTATIGAKAALLTGLLKRLFKKRKPTPEKDEPTKTDPEPPKKPEPKAPRKPRTPRPPEESEEETKTGSDKPGEKPKDPKKPTKPSFVDSAFLANFLYKFLNNMFAKKDSKELLLSAMKNPENEELKTKIESAVRDFLGSDYAKVVSDTLVAYIQDELKEGILHDIASAEDIEKATEKITDYLVKIKLSDGNLRKWLVGILTKINNESHKVEERPKRGRR